MTSLYEILRDNVYLLPDRKAQFLSSVFIPTGELRRKAEKTKVSEIEKILEHVR